MSRESSQASAMNGITTSPVPHAVAHLGDGALRDPVVLGADLLLPRRVGNIHHYEDLEVEPLPDPGQTFDRPLELGFDVEDGNDDRYPQFGLLPALPPQRRSESLRQ